MKSDDRLSCHQMSGVVNDIYYNMYSYGMIL